MFTEPHLQHSERSENSVTVNAQISAQLQISTRFELAPLLRLKICNKRRPSNKRPSLPRENMSFGTRYDRRDVYGLYGSFNKM